MNNSFKAQNQRELSIDEHTVRRDSSPGPRRRSVFFTKLLNWEFWPVYLTNVPVILIWLWFALRAKRLFFFSAVNPVIETGGVLGESKIGILRRIPAAFVPITVFVKQGTPFPEILCSVKEAGLDFPVIAKPDIGERGFLVSKIKNEDGLRRYAAANPPDFLIQKFIGLPVELAVMHHRFPGEKGGRVTSICIKDTLKVTGDGRSTVRQLMAAYPRAQMQLARFEAGFSTLLDAVPGNGETVELEPIGNHCRGTQFLNGNEHIDEALTEVFNEVVAQMDGIHYGRFDLKCNSIEDIRRGREFMVMEYNGIAAEPAHIYDPSIPVLKKYQDIYRHWEIIYKIYRVQASRGVRCMNFGEAWQSLKKYRAYMKAQGREVKKV